MRTVSVNIMNLCIPCANRCRYCLLSWDGKLRGIDYARGEAYARRFCQWAKENRPELTVTYGFGYSMDHPDLLRAIDFMQEIGSPTGRFLQMDGLAFRNPEAIYEFLSGVMAHGVELIDLTFYGTRAYHDRFAARNGDYDFMMEILSQAERLGLAVHCGIPVTQENMGQLDALIGQLERFRPEKIFCFVPHQEGRGISLNQVRLRQEDFDGFSERVKKCFRSARYKTEAQWLAEGNFALPKIRSLYLALTPENADFFEGLPFEDVISYLEKLDDDYYSVVPSLESLALRYGDRENTQMYSQHDLYLKYQHRYLAENNLHIYDINDERQCSCRRI